MPLSASPVSVPALSSVSAREFREALSEYLSRVGYGLERLIVERHGKPIAALIPIGDLEILQAVYDKANREELDALDDPEMPAPSRKKKTRPLKTKRKSKAKPQE